MVSITTRTRNGNTYYYIREYIRKTEEKQGHHKLHYAGKDLPPGAHYNIFLNRVVIVKKDFMPWFQEFMANKKKTREFYG